jgi:2-dehydro-3-deoxyphosphogluconate aldolase/(4S)-4-hydroxy-2-oxoglutarate aldolase
MRESTAKKIRSFRLVPVAVIEDAGVALDLADALLAVGLPIIEVTFRTEVAVEAIARIAKHRPLAAGAQFGVAPGLNERTVEAAAKAGMDFIPGIATPSEVEIALELNLKLLKFFPAEQAGGVNLLKALEGPYGQTGVQFIPTGGVNIRNLKDYLGLKSVVAVGGSWFVDKKLVAAGAWATITRLTQEALELTQTVEK